MLVLTLFILLAAAWKLITQVPITHGLSPWTEIATDRSFAIFTRQIHSFDATGTTEFQRLGLNIETGQLKQLSAVDEALIVISAAVVVIFAAYATAMTSSKRLFLAGLTLAIGLVLFLSMQPIVEFVFASYLVPWQVHRQEAARIILSSCVAIFLLTQPFRQRGWRFQKLPA